MDYRTTLYECRKERNISQNTLALELGISRRAIGKIERDQENLSLEMAYRISAYFNKSVYELFPLNTH